MAMVKLLLEYCFDLILKDLDKFQEYNLSETLPVDLKEKLFSYYTNSISNEPSNSPFPITSYPEDRYRDVQLVNRITCQRVIPLCFAMWSSLDYKYEKVRKLIEEEACDVNENDLEGFCPLHYAAIYGRIDACKLLLIHGADCSRKNNFGKTPSDLAQDVKVQQMIKLRAILFRKDEVKEMEQDLQNKRKQIADYQRKQLREDFLKQSKYLGNILVKKGFDSKDITSPLSSKSIKTDKPPQQSQESTTINVNNNQQQQQQQQNNISLTTPPVPLHSENNSNNNISNTENTFRSYIAQIDLPQPHQSNNNLTSSGGPTREPLSIHSLSSIGIPRTRQSNSTIVPHPINVVNNHFNTINSLLPTTMLPTGSSSPQLLTNSTPTTSNSSNIGVLEAPIIDQSATLITSSLGDITLLDNTHKDNEFGGSNNI
ncbi:hypothetical protein DLAC_06503 [Tieghemostelium lacteum]|uniref:Uncharacterized protein n=1 Tax=Tieghemostelium lacteum TaxID=361077 RepID=A0A151ZF63_TIELA|nr:hypothetical protein DLAC_06503 [Tieghemostelium lacteum]|eukprot:KYQ92514.1 hypothetical protein DLAC_06503 [Tieghemostelium lacteum]